MFLVNAGTDAFSLYVLHIPHGNIPYTIVQTAILFTVMWLVFDGTIREKIRLIVVGDLLALLAELSSMLILFLAFDVRCYNYQEPSEELSAMQLISIDDFLVCIGIMIFIMNRKLVGFRELRRYLVMIPLFAVSHMIYLILYYKSGVELINQNLSLQLMLQALMCFLIIGFYRLVKQHLAPYFELSDIISIIPFKRVQVLQIVPHLIVSFLVFQEQSCPQLTEIAYGRCRLGSV